MKKNSISFTTSVDEKFSVEITLNGEEISPRELIRKDSKSSQFDFVGTYGDEKISGKGESGDDCIWFPIDYDIGIKVVYENEKYRSLEESIETLEIVSSYEEENPGATPEILLFGITELDDKSESILYIEMERVLEEEINIHTLYFVPPPDREWVSENVHIPPSSCHDLAKFFLKTSLLPEDEWYKRDRNLIDGKIVDFHRFYKKEDRYTFPSNGSSKEEMEEVYKNMVSRYVDIKDPAGLPKWKGKIYQGFHFDNDYTMEGYTSGDGFLDSYRKLPYIPYNKCEGKKVLDLGSNQGFFSFQAALHGASSVTGVEMTKADVDAANDIKNILSLDNVEFVNGDIVKYVKEDDNKYSIIILNSVLHQVFPSFSPGAKEFLEKIASMTDYFVFETPLNHKLMRLSPEKVRDELGKYFKQVRLLNVYDAYSTGYRGNYICCS